MSVRGIVAAIVMALPGLAAAQTTTLPPRTDLNCTIRPLRVVEVAALLDGVIAEVHAAPGQTVEAGAPLASLDARLLQAELDRARAFAGADAALRAAETRRDGVARREARLREGLERRAVSQADYDAAALDLAIAEQDVAQEQERLDLAGLEVARIEAELALSVIRAPVTGIVGENLIDPGETTQGRPLAQIYVNDPLRVEVFVPAGQVPDILAQDSHLIEVAGRPSDVRLDYVAQIADVASNTISIFFFLENTQVVPGSRCLMRLDAQRG